MDEKYKRSYRWRLIAMIVLFLLVLAVIFIAIFALPNDEGQPTTETNKTISGSVNFTSDVNDAFYIKEVRLQEGEDEAEVLSITPGYINNGFTFTEIGEVSSDDITLYFDIINSIMNTAVISSSWTDTEVDGVTFSVIEESRYLSAGTGEEITDSTEINGTLILELNLYNAETFNLSSITMSFDEPNSFANWTFVTNEEDKTATLTQAITTNGVLEVPSYISYNEETQTWVSGPDYKVVGIDGLSQYHGAVATNIESLILPETVVVIDKYAFCMEYESDVLDLSNTNIEYIGEDAFMNAPNLTTVIFPESLTTLYRWAFRGCSNLTNVIFPTNTKLNDIANGGLDPFTSCDNIQPAIVDEYGVEYLGNEDNPYVVLWDASGLATDSYVINDKCKIVYNSAFNGLKTLENVTLPSSITYISDYAFQDCTNLATIDLSGCVNLTGIGYMVFSSCTSLTTIDLSGCTSLTSIGNSAFENCSSLENVKLPNSIEVLEDNIFDGCSLLQTQTDDYGVEYIGNDENPYLVLFDAHGLTTETYTVNNDCKIISHNAFSGLTSITSIKFSSSIEYIVHDAFNECINLAIVDFSECTKLTSIGEYAFDSSGLTTVDLSGCTSLTSIGNSAFENCSSLTNITLPENLTSIGDNTFSDCTSIINITLPENLTSIGYGAFQTCTNLTSVEFTDPAGWQVVSLTAITTDIDEAQLQDPTTASELLTATYYDYYWRKVET